MTIDCADPRRIADFWQEAIGFRKRSGVGEPYITLSECPTARSINHLTIQKVPEAKTAKLRAHLDLFVGDSDAEVARLSALGATVVEVDTGDVSTIVSDVMNATDPAGGAADSLADAPTSTPGHLGFVAVVMADPEGNEFCVVSRPNAPADAG